VVTLSGANATGTLDGKTIKAQFTGADRRGEDRRGEDKSGAAVCGDGLTLTATLDRLTEPRALSGTLSIEGCSSCALLEFRAVRQPRSAVGAH
jgi:hypothetical protein